MWKTMAESKPITVSQPRSLRFMPVMAYSRSLRSTLAVQLVLIRSEVEFTSVVVIGVPGLLGLFGVICSFWQAVMPSNMAAAAMMKSFFFIVVFFLI